MLAAAAKSARGHALHFASHALKADGDFLRAARQALADKHLALPEEQREQEDYTTLHALNAALANGSTALIRADYLVKLAEEGGVLGHRSQLPAEAIYEGPVWQYEEDFNYHGVVIVALSYMWGGPDHPDPKGEQLRDVAKFLKWLQSAEGSDSYGNCTIAVFWDWASLYQDKPRGSRTDEQTASFKAGLGNVNLWYCHTETITLMNKKTPAGREKGYGDSGWPTFEEAVSQFVKDKEKVLELETMLNALDGEAVKEWGEKRYYVMANKCAATAKRGLAIAPGRMDGVLAGRFFTNKADIAFVQKKYRQVFESVVTKARKLKFTWMDWITKEQWAGTVRGSSRSARTSRS